jgi:hypothetical protein
VVSVYHKLVTYRKRVVFGGKLRWEVNSDPGGDGGLMERGMALDNGFGRVASKKSVYGCKKSS